MSRKFGPKKEDHPGIGKPCFLCEVPFVAGDYTALLMTKPADEEEAAKEAAGRAFNALAEEIHWACWDRVRDQVINEIGEEYGWSVKS